VARRRGAEVCLVSGPSALPAPAGIERVMVRSALEMQRVLIERFARTDVVLKAAAVSDYRPASFVARKIKRGAQEIELKLKHNTDIIQELGRLKTHQILVGFAAETEELQAHAYQKLQRKNLDLIVANDINRPDSGFAVDNNEVTIIERDGRAHSWPLLSKEEVAFHVLDRVVALRQQRRPGGFHA
jgi:phosphopantothenoylcysteine decarboxylase / phosphopantothenate---cysteine ligase